jgi:uncharacterized protein (DUF1499 family)
MTDPIVRSRLITFLGITGVVCLLAMPLAVLAVRLGLHISIGLPAFALSSVVALLVIIALVIASLLPRYRAQRLRALLWSLPAFPPVVIFLAVLAPAGDYPPIHDITTNTEDPPRFDSGVFYRGDDANPIDIKPDVIAIQKQHYTGLDTIRTTMSPSEAFERASTVAEGLEWEIYNSDPANGLIEALCTSFWFGFKDDVVIRIRETETGSEVDLRSVSRVGRSDLGANAARIAAFLERF